MIVFEARIVEVDKFPALRQVNKFLSKEKHTLLVNFITKKDIKDLKANATARGMSTRHFTSLASEVKGIVKGCVERMRYDLKDKQQAFTATKKTIAKLDEKIKKINTDIAGIETYRDKVRRFKAGKLPRKPRLKKSLQQVDLKKLRNERDFLRKKIHEKKRRLACLAHKVKKLKANLEKGKISHAFGGSKLLKKSHFLDANAYANHEEWLADYRLKREGQSFWIGTHSETQRNLNAQYDYKSGTLSLRVPYALEAVLGERIELNNIFFSNKQERRNGHRVSPVLIKAFEEKREKQVSGKWVLQHVPFSYRIIERRKNEFYVQVSFEPHPNHTKTTFADGAIGLDLNTDHIAMVEMDRFGNPVESISLYLQEDGTREQQKAVLCDHIADICDYALSRRKSIVIEKLDFWKKRASLRELGSKKFAKLLSNFSYRQFHTSLVSRASRMGVDVKRVDPAYSSVIGAIKYNGHKGLSSHEAAALVIARRHLRYSERPKTHGTREETASILQEHDLAAFLKERSTRHVWSYYGHLNRTAREDIRSLKKRLGREKCFHPQRPSGMSVQLSRCREGPYSIPVQVEFCGTLAQD